MKKILFLLLLTTTLSSCYSVVVKNNDPSYKFFLLLKNNSSQDIINFLDNQSSSELEDILNGTNNPYGLPVIAVSILQKKASIIDTLVKYGADVNARGLNGATALLIASELGDLNVIKILVEQYKAEPSIDKEGKSPLHYACLAKNNKALGYLVQMLKKDINAQDKLGNTPLYYATVSKNKEAVALLLKAGANANIANQEKQTPITYANNMNYENLSALMTGKNLGGRKRK